MITKLAGINYEAFDEMSKGNICGVFDSEENLVKLDEKLPDPTIAEVIGVIIGGMYGLSIDELTESLSESDDVKAILYQKFEKMAKYAQDKFEFTIFDKV